MPHHFIELDIIRSIEVSQLLNSISVYLHVSPPLRLAKAAGRAAALRLFKAGKTLGAVEIEVFVGDDAFQPKKVLHPSHLPCWVCDETLSAHKMDLSQREVVEPVFKVQSIQADPNGVPGHVHDSQALIPEGQVLEAWQVRRFG